VRKGDIEKGPIGGRSGKRKIAGQPGKKEKDFLNISQEKAPIQELGEKRDAPTGSRGEGGGRVVHSFAHKKKTICKSWH